MTQKIERLTKKELEIQGCRSFVCPNLSLIDEKGKELGLKKDTIKKAKDLAIKYFKKTYRSPHYSSVKHVLPAFLYIAGIIEDEIIYQSMIADVFDVSHSTIRKWYKDIVETLGLNIELIGRKKEGLTDENGNFICPNLDIIEEGGKKLGLKKGTVERAKSLAVRYFKIIYHSPNYRYIIKTAVPSLLYLAGLIENDRRTQMDISITFDISESTISLRYKDILDVLCIKIIYSYNRRTLKIIGI